MNRLSSEDAARLREVLRWAYAHGFRPQYASRPGGVRTWYRYTGTSHGQVVVFKPGPRPTLTCYRIDTPYTRVDLANPAGIGQILDALVLLEFIPARFGDAGRQALGDHARVCERYAEHLIMQHSDDRGSMRMFYAAGMYRAAQSAVSHAATLGALP